MSPLGHQISPFAQELTALFVEDDGATRLLLTAQLRGVFKEVITATNGQEGLEAFWMHGPQIVLTDDQMPVMSGIAMTEEIRQLDPKVPIILITASMDKELLVRAINLGVSSFIPKPVILDNLKQSVSLVVGMLENDHLQRKNVEQALALLQFRERYHEVQEELAFRKELSILQNDYLYHRFTGDGPDRGEWLAQVVYFPHDIMCGDSFSLRRLPDGSQLVFIADAMGKGLAASLTTSLSVYAFNLQVDALCADEPFRFGEFVRGYTRLLSRRLLEDEVFSLGLAWLPARGALLEVATFGMPPILVGGPGQSIRKLGSNNPPLSAYTEEVRTTAHELCSARSLLFYTDGLSEAETASGELYREYLDADFLGSGSGNQLLQAYRARVAEPADDATFLLLRRVDAAASWQDTLVVQSRLDLVEQACLDLEHRLAICTRLEAGPRSEFSVAIREALLNAYEHGSLEISGALKRRLLETGVYFEHLLACETAVDRLITVHISVQAEAGNHLVQVVIQDEGQGFVPPPPWFDDRDGLTVCGRGLKMVKKYTDAFHFNAQGNAITLMKIYHGGSDAADTNGPH